MTTYTKDSSETPKRKDTKTVTVKAAATKGVSKRVTKPRKHKGVFVNLGNRTLTIVRGVSGSGKSILATCLMETTENVAYFEADMWFELSKDEKYVFDAADLQIAHDWCKLNIQKALIDKEDNVIVANTFTRYWEMKPYLDLAIKHEYNVQIIECQAAFGNVHGVPQTKVKEMIERWEPFNLYEWMKNPAKYEKDLVKAEEEASK